MVLLYASSGGFDELGFGRGGLIGGEGAVDFACWVACQAADPWSIISRRIIQCVLSVFDLDFILFLDHNSG